ncbi:TldD/PmbA family protein [Nakamurella antarctica]|uniref:TldD/PmbA family protein n=1 Tax=Nakamurella antarctica TaxID=1902245 RepID=A0A3G9A043_9ACTN|nr:metallopeptidase TldD-related protein [Nakamurella antarctica]AZI59151.1 TldD/PmbA family protein [Nakamurella antarctica]
MTITAQQIVEAALGFSISDGCIVVATVNSTANIRWANNTVTTSGVSNSLSWFVVSVVGAAAGTVESSATDLAGIAGAVAQSEAAAKAAGPARDAQALIEGGACADFDEGAVDTDFSVYSALIPSLAQAFEDAQSADRILYGFARHESATTYLGTSTGVRRRWVQPTGTVEVNAKSADLTRSSWAGLSTADFTDVDVRVLAESLGMRLGWAKRHIDIAPGRYDTVLPATAVADMMIYLAWSAGGRAAHEGRSAFSAPAGGTRMGERLVDRHLSLFSEPTMQGIEAAPFVIAGGSSDETSVFDNGAPIGRGELITNGVISGLLHTRASAAEFGDAFAPMADNLILAGGDETRSTLDLVAGVKRGLLVTSQWYIREVDPISLLLTGLTRDGVFLIENGEITGAVNNFRFNMSPLDMLRQVGDVGRSERALSREWSDWFTRTQMPSMRIDGFNMSSVSQAQ